MLCRTKTKQKVEETTPQNAKVVIGSQAMATKQSLPACAAVSTLRQTSKKMATETLKKTVPKLSSTAPIRSEVTVKMISLQPTQPDTGEQESKDEKLRINKTQSETEFEDVSLVTSMLIDKTQASISQRVDDSADTGEYVDDLPEDREESSSE